MDERIAKFLAAARSCALSPMEHAQVRAALAAHTTKITPSTIFRESSDALQLTDYEKAIGRAKLLRFMRGNPLDERGSSFLHMLFRPFAATLASAFILTLAGGGMAYAAEGSLPGDLLYPIKVHITEPVISTLSFTPARRAQWNVRIIERRLTEANALEGKSNPDSRQMILRSQMEENATDLRRRLRNLSPEERKSTREDFLSELTQHQESLLQIQESTGVPPALETLVEDAANEPENGDEGDHGNASSSSAEKKQDQRGIGENSSEKKRVITPLPIEKESREASRASSSGSRSASSSHPQKETSERSSTSEEGMTDQHKENAAKSLLRLLRESSSSSPNESSADPADPILFEEQEHSSSSPEHSSKSHDTEEEKKKDLR